MCDDGVRGCQTQYSMCCDDDFYCNERIVTRQNTRTCRLHTVIFPKPTRHYRQHTAVTEVSTRT